ncbi:glycoside hydrolase family 44 [Dyadobacter luteus]|uniref:Glycoside hydrolase family 44 n=1 Tax=Dyadobacter luteus TaxID=2259619 RepID=A0A3D8YH53_9BACT|nr:glycoside hydrolase family 44 protein [Dyadobacter luteus]REA63716.1 glycoside hydrolase family 44 [Dyadobacter luteus]
MPNTIKSAKSLAFATVLLCLFHGVLSAQTIIEIDAEADIKPVSPYLYGRNNSFSSTNPNWTLPAEDLIRLRDAGVTFFRESGGNNSSKYNWRKKLSSHPDWYNNVYTNNWDQAAQTLQKNFPGAQGMWAFPLLGYAAKTTSANFADWDYNRSQWWEGVNQNLAGNGMPNPNGTKAKVEGDINLYLEKWNADSAVAILDHWFGDKGQELKKEGIRYWNMDNEPEIWSGTHDDVMPRQISAQEFMTRYIELSKKARAKDPQIKLVGPVTANEWQWYNWDGKTVSENGKSYPWLEYFIKNVAEEQKRSGVRLLDVLDIHFYPASKKAEEIVQMHRVYFDKTYNFPEANGVKTINGGYDNSITKEYIFARCNDWLNQYLGAGHGVTLGVTETGIDDSISSSVTAVWYASTIGEFMKNGVELFTPWTWKTGMWETLHLMSRYNQRLSVKGTSSNETMVSVYPSLNASKDSLTVVVVNRSLNKSEPVAVHFKNFNPLAGSTEILTLSTLPSSETFQSHTDNALKKAAYTVSGSSVNLTLPAMSVTSFQLKGGGQILGTETDTDSEIKVFPNPSWDSITVKWGNRSFHSISILDKSGKKIMTTTLQKMQRETVLTPELKTGVYLIRLTAANGESVVKKIIAR